MKIDRKSKTVRLTLTRGEFRDLAKLLEFAQDEKEKNPVTWLTRPARERKMLDALLGICAGMTGYADVRVDDATKLSPEYQEGVLKHREFLNSESKVVRENEQRHAEHDLGLGPGALARPYRGVQKANAIKVGDVTIPDESVTGTGRRVYKAKRESVDLRGPLAAHDDVSPDPLPRGGL